LIYNEYVKIHNEEHKLAILCLQYVLSINPSPRHGNVPWVAIHSDFLTSECSSSCCTFGSSTFRISHDLWDIQTFFLFNVLRVFIKLTPSDSDYATICGTLKSPNVLALIYKLSSYLLFDCFDPSLSDKAIECYTMNGYYAFEDYAILHWVDHLEASIPYLLSNSVDDTDDIGSAINNFQDAYGANDASRDDIPQELRDRCKHISDADFYENLLLLVSSTRKSRTKQEKIDALGELGHAIAKHRAILEGSRTSGLEFATKSKLEQYYGTLWHKCPRHACFYFHEGFPEATRRDNHVSRHEKPFFCTESSCARSYYGFSTEKELNKHTNVNHPDPSALFPKIKKPPAKHTCKICSKEFTRAHNLNAHKRTHSDLRPYGCQVCGRKFVRRYDRERHVEKLHSETDSEVGESSQETLPRAELEIQDGDPNLEKTPVDQADVASATDMVD
jgi:hypothetical protein